jgi:hypothetical protein
MTYATHRRARNRSVALACATALAAAGLTQTGAIASTVHAAAGPSVSNLAVTPKKPTKGEGFKVSFKTKAGGNYEVFIATANSGDVLAKGKTKTGTITTKRLGKKLPAGKYTVGVRVIVGEKDKFARQPLTIKK